MVVCEDRFLHPSIHGAGKMSHPGAASVACSGAAAVSSRGAATILRRSIHEAPCGTCVHRLHHPLGRYESLLPWAQSATDGYIVEFHPSDGTDGPSIWTE
jgi:hypothetical protein